MSAPRFTLALLGRLDLHGPTGPVDLGRRKVSGLLVFLACTSPKPQPRERISDLLWGSRSDTLAQQNLRSALYRLRRSLGPGAITSHGETVALAADRFDCDVMRFEALIQDGRRVSLAAAVGLYRGSLAPDLNIAEPSWSDWIGGERRRLEELALDALVRSGQLELEAGAADKALDAAHRALAINGLREDAHRLSIQALAATGRRAEALKHYRDLVELLKEELETEPDARTKSLIARLAGTNVPMNSLSIGAHSSAERIEPASGVHTALLMRPEQRQLTVVVCDLTGSALGHRSQAPGEMHGVIASFQERAAETVAQFGGIVTQYQGNGVTACFGYPTANEDDADQAVRAGLAILRISERLASGVDLQASIGIATGLVVVGETQEKGRPARLLVTGETPSHAARLQAAAGQVVIAAETRRLVGRLFDCHPFPPIEAKGRAERVDAWLVRGERAGMSRFEARRGDVLTPLAGRQDEVDLLLRRWGDAERGEGRVVLLSGEPGIGKSRIVENLQATLAARPHALVRFNCSPHHVHTPLFPFIERLERDLRFEPDSSAGARHDTLHALLKPIPANALRDVALLAELLALPADERYPQLALIPQQKRALTLAVLVEELERLATALPLLIVFEDAHWIDPTSLDLLDRLVARVARLRSLLVMTFRLEFQPAWIGQPHVTSLSLSRLSDADSDSMIRIIAQGAPLADAAIEWVISHAEGVPLFVEELTNSMLESDQWRESGGSGAGGPSNTFAVPATLHASLVARLDRLGPAKDAALIGAAIGREFSHELIAAVSDLASANLDSALDRLVAAGLLSRRGSPPDAIYSFKHALVRDAAYLMMLKSERRRLHARIAAALTDRFPGVAEALPELVARHFTEAEIAESATDYWVKAGRRAAGRSAFQEAANCLDRALEIAGTLPSTALAQDQEFEIRFELGQALVEISQIRCALDCFEQAATLADRLGDDRRRCRVLACTTLIHALTGELDEARRDGTQAFAIALSLGDATLLIRARSFLAQVHFYRGEHQRVVAVATENLALLPVDMPAAHFGIARPPTIFDRGRLVYSLAELGRFAEAEEIAAEAIGLVPKMDYVYDIGWAHLTAGWVHLVKGDFAQARPRIEFAAEVLSEGKAVPLLPLALGLSAWCLAVLGEARRAEGRLRDGEKWLQHHVAIGQVGTLGWFYPWFGRGAFVLGRLADASRLGEHAVAAASRHPGWTAHARCLLGDVAFRSEGFASEGCEAHYATALSLAEECGMRPLVAHCHWGLARLYGRMGKRKHALEEAVAATAIYRELSMTPWLRRAESEMPLLARS